MARERAHWAVDSTLGEGRASIAPGAPDENLVRVKGHREGLLVVLEVSDTPL